MSRSFHRFTLFSAPESRRPHRLPLFGSVSPAASTTSPRRGRARQAKSECAHDDPAREHCQPAFELAISKRNQRHDDVQETPTDQSENKDLKPEESQEHNYNSYHHGRARVHASASDPTSSAHAP